MNSSELNIKAWQAGSRSEQASLRSIPLGSKHDTAQGQNDTNVKYK